MRELISMQLPEGVHKADLLKVANAYGKTKAWVLAMAVEVFIGLDPDQFMKVLNKRPTNQEKVHSWLLEYCRRLHEGR